MIQAEAEVLPSSSLVEVEVEVGIEVGFEVGVEAEVEVEVRLRLPPSWPKTAQLRAQELQ